MQRGSITVGAPVFAQDGEQLGEVKEVRGNYFKVDAPMQPDYWLRTDAVSTGDAGQVMLSISKDRLGDYQVMNPDEVDVDSGRLTDYRASTVTTEHEHDLTHGDRSAGYASTAGYTTDTSHTHTDTRDWDTREADRVRLHEEQLIAQKRSEEAGEVRIGKEVIEEQQSIDVPLRREEVYVERRPVSGEVTDGEIGDDRTEIRVPVMEEEVEVQKRTVATEEITAGKRAIEETHRVTDTVRREEARIETNGDVEVRGEGTLDRDSRYDRTDGERRG